MAVYVTFNLLRNSFKDDSDSNFSKEKILKKRKLNGDNNVICVTLAYDDMSSYKDVKLFFRPLVYSSRIFLLPIYIFTKTMWKFRHRLQY